MPLNIYIYIHSDNRDHHVVCGQLCALGCEITMWDHHVSYHDSDDYEYVRRVSYDNYDDYNHHYDHDYHDDDDADDADADDDSSDHRE